MKKTFIILLVLLCGTLTACGGDASPVVGTWTVSNYEYDGTTYKASQVDELCELRGYSVLAWSETSLKLTDGGSVYLEREEDGKKIEITGTYTVGDTFIELVSDDGEKKLLDYDGEHIYFDTPLNVVLILTK